ncbi:DUF2442 domain-containing protein [Candidatus Poriferisodalis sp.]|uniref:DUF2442 domain-containing protein n=1 Tax=Candidatus Poriferisodalis sp. TaxID=3101277 RepID=UPI003C6F7E71
MSSAADVVRPVEVRACDGCRIWLRFSDGVKGEVDLSDLAGRGVFAAWSDRSVFESVRIGVARAICWGDDIDVCPDALYLRLTGIPPHEYLSGDHAVDVNA